MTDKENGPLTAMAIQAERYRVATQRAVAALVTVHRYEQGRQAEREAAIERIIARETRPEDTKPYPRTRAEDRTRSDEAYAAYVAAEATAKEQLATAQYEAEAAKMAHERAAILARLTLTEVEA